MKYIVSYLIALLTITCFLSAETEKQNIEEIYTLSIQSIKVNRQNSTAIANITLSNGTEWRAQCTFDEELTLTNWKKGDEILVDTNQNQDGICLKNLQHRSKIYATIIPKSLAKLPKITKVEHTDGGWFSRPQQKVYLSDGTCWANCVTYWQISLRWAQGQKVLISKGTMTMKMVNLSIQYDPKYQDDRSASVEYFVPET